MIRAQAQPNVLQHELERLHTHDIVELHYRISYLGHGRMGRGHFPPRRSGVSDAGGLKTQWLDAGRGLNLVEDRFMQMFRSAIKRISSTEKGWGAAAVEGRAGDIRGRAGGRGVRKELRGRIMQARAYLLSKAHE
jgi:hypothetical protein